MSRSAVLGRATQVVPDSAARDAAAEVAGVPVGSAEIVLRRSDGTEIVVPPQLVEIMFATADELAAGHAVTVLASESLLTPAEAGELLGLSRPFVARLLDEGQIPSDHLPGSRHRVIRLEDVLAFAERRNRRREGRRRLSAAVEDADLPY